MSKSVSLWWVVIRSLLITCAVATVIGTGIGILLNSAFAGAVTFVIVIVAQFAISSLVSVISENKNAKAEFLAAQVLKEASERRLPYDLSCAFCSKTNRVGVSFSEETTFECSECNQPNKVYIQFTTVRLTVPLSQREPLGTVDMDEDPGIRQDTINASINVT